MSSSAAVERLLQRRRLLTRRVAINRFWAQYCRCAECERRYNEARGALSLLDVRLLVLEIPISFHQAVRQLLR